MNFVFRPRSFCMSLLRQTNSRLVRLVPFACIAAVFVASEARPVLAQNPNQRGPSLAIPGDAGKGNKWAVVVGCNYSEGKSTLNTLQYTVSDAKLFLDTLDVDKSRMVFLASGEETPTLKRVSDAVEETARKCGPSDVLFFYFAGHGRESGGKSYLAPADVRFEDLNTYISVSKLRALLSDPAKCRARTKILVLDACQSGSPRGETKAFETTGSGLSGTVTIAACQVNQSSWEFPDLKHGVFTYYLAEGLNGAGAGQGQDLVFVSQLREYVTKMVAQRTMDHPPGQTPVFILPESFVDSPIARRRPGMLAKLENETAANTEISEREPLKPGVFVVATSPDGKVDEFLQGRLQSELVKLGYPVVSREFTAQFVKVLNDPKDTSKAAAAAKKMEARFLIRVTSEFSQPTFDGAVGRYIVNCTITAEVLDVYGNVKGAASVDADQHPNAGSGGTALVAKERARQRAVENILSSLEDDLDTLIKDKKPGT